MTSMSINVPHVLISYTHTNILTWQMCSTLSFYKFCWCQVNNSWNILL